MKRKCWRYFGCEHFHQYLYGQKEVIVESDHKPLQARLQTTIHQAPLRLQSMILRGKPYAIKVEYTPRSHLIIADALKRAPHNSQSSDIDDEEFEINVLESGEISVDMFAKLTEETQEDSELQQLYQLVMSGWPLKKTDTPVETRPYWSYRDEISCYDGLLFKGDRIIVPLTLRKEILSRIHEAHLGAEKCKARARGAVFWPGMNGAIEDMVSQCGTCNKYKRSNPREPMIPQEIPDRPWVTVAADIFFFKGKDYLLVVDYFSKYPEVVRINQKNSDAVILAMKDIFSRHGIPEKIFADNMPFNSLRFKEFAKSWKIKVVTSSPHYPRSNGLVERNVQTMKLLLKKAYESKQDAFLALLEFRNSPITGMEQSPAELLMGRKLRTKLPVPKHLLEPQTQPQCEIQQRLHERQLRQKKYYDSGTKSLSPLCPNQLVRIQQKGEWNPAVVIGEHQTPRSYIVGTQNGNQLRRNRIHLRPTKEKRMEIDPTLELNADGGEVPDETPDHELPRSIERIPVITTQLRRSTRVSKAPSRLIEEV